MLFPPLFRARRLGATIAVAMSTLLVVSASADPAKPVPASPMPLKPADLTIGAATAGPATIAGLVQDDTGPTAGLVKPAIVEPDAPQPTTDSDGPPTLEKIFAAICAAGIEHPEIVMRQAMLETGNLTGPMLMSRNNLFGFRGQGYLSFASWRESVAYYKKWQARRYVDPGEDYFAFLTRIRYASGPSYKGFVMSQRWTNTCPAKTV